MDPDRPFHVPLSRLDPAHPPPAIGSDPTQDDEDPGTATAYIAEPLKRAYSPYTIEGMIQGTGKFAEAASKRGGSAKLLVGVIVTSFLLALALGFINNLRALFGS
ncbi:MAG: hypothetical protein QOK42_521 [Frankiaceae bacterium]|nr:hypothetical protein [Frankiaceae bacterium]